ncbi:MAG TPA: phage tail tape measure protein [Beijerinckiaceae bacterium]|nr:phage tail tape measure protein [Beijerinckiaceae bacterium]
MADDASDFDAGNAARERQLQSLDKLAKGFGTSLSGAFAKGITSGKELDGVLASLGKTLVAASLRSALKPLETSLKDGLGSLFKGLFAGAGTTGEGTTAMALGGVVSGGQVVPFAQGGVVAAPAYFPLGRGLGLMGERGAEAIMPLARGPDGRLGVRAAGGAERPLAVTVNIATPDAESFRRSEAQVAAALARAVSRGRRGL